MKTKVLSALLCLLCACSLAVGCAAPQEAPKEKPSASKNESSSKKDNSSNDSRNDDDDYTYEDSYFEQFTTSYGEVAWEDDELIVVLEMDTSGSYDWDYTATDDSIIEFSDNEYAYGEDLPDELLGSYDGVCMFGFIGIGEGTYTLHFFEYDTDNTSDVYGELYLSVSVDEDGYIYDVTEV